MPLSRNPHDVLTPSDRMLWLDYTQNISPLAQKQGQHSQERTSSAHALRASAPILRVHAKKPPVVTREAFAAMLEERVLEALTPGAPFQTSEVQAQNSPHETSDPIEPLCAQPASISRRQPVPFDPRVRQKIMRGQQSLEAAVDLHGLTQEQAYRILCDFIQLAHARGLRNVLVITGKGNPKGALLNARSRGQGPHSPEASNDSEPGVLRRKVPQWLRLPALSAYVLMVDFAAPVHGGEGALYIRLRRASGAREGEHA
jgi:DNA-nicking Smr family endonuclease